MKRGSTFFLRAVIVLIGLVVLAICTVALPQIIIDETKGDFDYLPLLVGLYVPALPFFYALYQGMQLLKFIDNHVTFSEKSVEAFNRIKYCAVLIGGIFVVGLPYIFQLAQNDDAPGLVAMALVIAFASFVIATFAAVLQKLVQNAVDIKKENDLTV